MLRGCGGLKHLNLCSCEQKFHIRSPFGICQLHFTSLRAFVTDRVASAAAPVFAKVRQSAQ